MRFITRLILGTALAVSCALPAMAVEQQFYRGFVFKPLPDPALYLKRTSPRDQTQPANRVDLMNVETFKKLTENDIKFLGKKERYAAMTMPGVSQNIQKLVAIQLGWSKLGGFNGKGSFLRGRTQSLIATVDVAAVTAVQAALDRGVIKNQTAKAALAAVLYKVAIAKPELKDQIVLVLKSMAKTLYKREDGYQLIALIGAKRLMGAEAGEIFHGEFLAAQRPGADYKYMLLMYKGVLDAAATNVRLGALNTVGSMKR